MMNKVKKSAAFVLAVVMLLLSSCGNASNDSQTNNTASSVNNQNIEKTTESAQSGEQTETSVLDTLPKADFGGETIRTITMNEIWWQLTEISSEELTGEVINDAIYNRNLETENRLNIKFEVEYRNVDIGSEVRSSIMAGESNFDFIMSKMNTSGALAQEDLFLDFNNITSLDMTNPAWDQNANDYFSVLGKLYYGVSDISLGKNEAIWVYMFNKNMLKDFNLEDPYELVKNGKWTFDKSYEMMEAVAADLDGDGKFTDADRFGLATHNVNYYALLIGGGEPLAEIGNNGSPSITAGDDRFTAVYDKISSLFGKDNYSLMEYEGKVFMEGRALLCGQVMACVRLFREMEDDFGIIPVPKYDEAQSQYYSYVIPYDVFAASIPITSKDPEMTGTVLQTMAILSDYYITPAYYDVTIQGKGLRDEESLEMLDLIRDTTVYDLAMMYNWASFAGNLATDLQNQKEFASNYKRKQKAIDKEIQKMIDNFSNNQN